MTVTAPPRPPRPSDPVDAGEFEALVEALIEEARKRAQRRRRRNGAVVTLVALVGVALFAVVGRSAQSQTASPALSARSSLPAATATSKIAYINEGTGGGYCGTVWVMNADGSGQRRLANGGVPGCGQEWGHAWSPDGREIAFVGGSSPPGSSPPKIYVMNADGSGQRELTRTTGFPDSPAWSPDGRKIAFVSRRDGNLEIYVMNADGTEQRRLTRNTVRDSFPVWSPDGRRIAFVSRRDGNLEIYVMNADGSEQRRLTRNTVRDSYPVWSPDGRRIAFESNWQVWVMNADGSGQREADAERGAQRCSRLVARREEDRVRAAARKSAVHPLVQRLRHGEDLRGLGHERRRERAGEADARGEAQPRSWLVTRRAEDRVRARTSTSTS